MLKQQVQKAAELFPGQVEIQKLDALGSEAETYGIMSTPLIVINGEVVSIGRVLPAVKSLILFGTPYNQI